jgi:hypothetical protein
LLVGTQQISPQAVLEWLSIATLGNCQPAPDKLALSGAQRMAHAPRCAHRSRGPEPSFPYRASHLSVVLTETPSPAAAALDPTASFRAFLCKFIGAPQSGSDDWRHRLRSTAHNERPFKSSWLGLCLAGDRDHLHDRVRLDQPLPELGILGLGIFAPLRLVELQAPNFERRPGNAAAPEPCFPASALTGTPDCACFTRPTICCAANRPFSMPARSSESAPY